jgi:hypothetical protein
MKKFLCILVAFLPLTTFNIALADDTEEEVTVSQEQATAEPTDSGQVEELEPAEEDESSSSGE